MDSPDVDTLQRLRGALASANVPADLAVWALGKAAASMPARERNHLRDRYLRAAAEMMAGSVESKVRRIRVEALALQRDWRRFASELSDVATVRGCVHAAMQLDLDMPTSMMQLRRILTTRRY